MTPKKSDVPKAAKPRKQVTKKQLESPRQLEPPSHQQIAELAEKYWAERGWPQGSPEEDWLRAEQELMGRAS
jgi:hypothetical protein